jgi:hypothetical protein
MVAEAFRMFAHAELHQQETNDIPALVLHEGPLVNLGVLPPKNSKQNLSATMEIS